VKRRVGGGGQRGGWEGVGEEGWVMGGVGKEEGDKFQ
jgi:hypothetical protein